MPNRTIYVSDADVLVFERAQELAGGNLSATIVRALRQFIERRERENKQMAEITLRVGKNIYSYKRFTGRLLTRGRFDTLDNSYREVFDVYQTAKGRLALYKRLIPNEPIGVARQSARLGDARQELTLDIYETLEALHGHVPDELYRAAELEIKSGGVEVLDI